MNTTQITVLSKTVPAENAASFFSSKLPVNNQGARSQKDAANGSRINDKKINLNDHQTFFRSCPANEIQRKSLHRGEENSYRQFKQDSSASRSSVVEEFTNSLAGGRPLGMEERDFFSPRLQYDFSDVRLHTDDKAAESVKNLNALAYTQGNNIVFAAGQYQPGTDGGKRLMAHELTHVVQQSNINQANILQRTPGNELPLVTFDTDGATPTKKDIRATLRDEDNRNSFSFGWSPDAIFSWESEVTIHDPSQQQFSNWVVGMLQLMKDYHLHIQWGSGEDPVKCGDNFPDADARDVVEPRSGGAWFNNLAVGGPFESNGDKKSTSIADSPGALYIPYQAPGPEQPALAGIFDFGCSFVTYLSAFNMADPTSPEAWKHLKSVSWQTALMGSFDGTKTKEEKLKVISGATSVNSVANGFPSKYPPKLVGMAALDKICPINQCWSPSLKCRQVLIP